MSYAAIVLLFVAVVEAVVIVVGGGVMWAMNDQYKYLKRDAEALRRFRRGETPSAFALGRKE